MLGTLHSSISSEQMLLHIAIFLRIAVTSYLLKGAKPRAVNSFVVLCSVQYSKSNPDPTAQILYSTGGMNFVSYFLERFWITRYIKLYLQALGFPLQGHAIPRSRNLSI